jgi:hypothetical protein
MALVLKDRVKETTSTAGTGSITLAGPVQGYQGFSVIGNGNTTYYTIAGTSEWEVGIGTYSGGVLSRDTVLGSSANGSKVAFSAGIKDVFVTYPADKAISTDTLPVTGATNTASPNATVNVASLTAATTTANGDLALVAKGTGALLAQVPTGTTAGGNKRGIYAVDLQQARFLANEVASGAYSGVLSGEDNKASGTGSCVSGGYSNYASDVYTTIAGGGFNAASNDFGAVVGGYNNIASGLYSIAGGGQSNLASGAESFVGGGKLNTASATNGVTSGGLSNANSGQYASLVGGRTNSLTGDYGAIGGGLSNTASSPYATISGGRSNTASRDYSTVGGGLSNTATGAISGDNFATVGGGTTNTVNAKSGTIAGGDTNSVTGVGGSIGGGEVNTVSGSRGTVAGGLTNTASGQNSSITGGANNLADSKNGVVVGGVYGTTRGIIGYAVFPSHDSPIAAAAGVSQSGLVILGRETTNNTPTVLRSNTSAAGATNQLILANNSAIYVFGYVIANVTGAGDTKSWIMSATVKRGANAGSTTVVGSLVASQQADAGASAWDVTVAADTVNGCLAVTVTGQASTTIRWVCKLESVEVAY